MTSPAHTHWETIRPWIDRLAIQVKELTSISATFVLTSAINHVKLDEEITDALLNDIDPVFKADGLFKSVGEILDHGFAVKVNDTRWNNYFLNVDEEEDEAVIILYGLRPGRMYEVELTIEQDETAVRKEFVTLKNDAEVSPPADEEEPETAEVSVDSHPASPEVASSKELTPPVTPESASPPRNITIEERTAHLQLTKTSIMQEHDSLTAQLKMARKESQRAENATRAEIEALKRAAEKQSVNDQRSKQKILALQEAVKQTLSASVDLEQQAKDLEETLPGLRKEERVVEDEHASVQDISKEKEAEVDQSIRADKKRMSELQSELSTLSNRVDKLAVKKDKLANETIPDLEQQLKDVRKEIEEAEAEKERLSQMAFIGDPIAALADLRAGRPITAMRQGIPPPAGWNGPGPGPNTGPTPFVGPPAGTFSTINAGAAPFYPRQPPTGPVRPIRGPIIPRVMNDFRPFDSVIPQVPQMAQQVQGDATNQGIPYGNFVPRMNRSSGSSQ